ncbi:winged helix-turn-helix domain-containing protein [uncultured Campylobacter sp.]|uniref:winged helix-turn-helix domain-containing protein n=1 Tax=uncultured Campylobacter sp. TaxID=218934 RepID=UPI0025D6EE35|nr:winged helix-turn-helix domain-containing protein [uncultured Campylobacter sp.]
MQTSSLNFEIFENLPYRVYVRDKNGVIVYANALAGEFLRLEMSKLVGKRYDEIFKDEEFIAHLQSVDSELFALKSKAVTAVKSFNRYYKKQSVFKVVDFIYVAGDGRKFIVTFLIEILDGYSLARGHFLPGLGLYDPKSMTISTETGRVRLTDLENSLFFLLYENRGSVVTYEEIFLSLDTYNKMNLFSLRALVKRIKAKIGGNVVKNVSKKGYMLDFR